MPNRGVCFVVALALMLSVFVSTVRGHVTECNTARVRVRNDSWFCIARDAATICAGSQPGACPVKGASAVGECAPHYASFQSATSDCVAPEDAQCVQLELSSQNWSCVFPGVANATAVTVVTALNATSLSTPTSGAFTTDTISCTALNGIVGGAVATVGVLSVVLVRRRRYRAPETPPRPAVTPLYFRESSYIRL